MSDAGTYVVVVTNSCGFATSSPATLTVNKADATCSVSGYSGDYDAAAHGATGSCTGVGGSSDVLIGLNLGSSFTNVPGGNANWTFSNNNYNDQSGSVAITITSEADDREHHGRSVHL